MKEKTVLYILRTVSIVAVLICCIALGGGIAKFKEKKAFENSRVLVYEGPSLLKEATEEDLKNTSEKNRKMDLLKSTNTVVERLEDEEDFTDSVDHYTRRVYYNLAQSILDIIQTETGTGLKRASRYLVTIDEFLKQFAIKVGVNRSSTFYHFLKKVYLKIRQ